MCSFSDFLLDDLISMLHVCLLLCYYLLTAKVGEYQLPCFCLFSVWLNFTFYWPAIYQLYQRKMSNQIYKLLFLLAGRLHYIWLARFDYFFCSWCFFLSINFIKLLPCSLSEISIETVIANKIPYIIIFTWYHFFPISILLDCVMIILWFMILMFLFGLINKQFLLILAHVVHLCRVDLLSKY